MPAASTSVLPPDPRSVPAITFIATIVYPLSIGAKVVLADLDPQTINIDPADVARKITPRTRMIVPVHIGGWPADMAPIMFPQDARRTRRRRRRGRPG